MVLFRNLLVIMLLITLSYFTYHSHELMFLKSFLGWFETFFHEISHGIASLITGGIITSIELNWDGSGLCYSSGGNSTLTTFSGYFGASIWGSFIYLLTSHKNKLINNISIFGLLSIMIVFIFYSGNINTIIILFSMILILAVIYYFRKSSWSMLFSQFIGIYIIFNSLYSPTYLFGYTTMGDHISMQNHTGISSIFWIYLWVVLCSLVGLVTIYMSYKNNKYL